MKQMERASRQEVSAAMQKELRMKNSGSESETGAGKTLSMVIVLPPILASNFGLMVKDFHSLHIIH